ncbi:hypothetical protein GP486_004324 [Trichoglossum hirsutum]|uniref:Fe2OG dioxygenase domain-containing protein n=1 Tax=Trichoglossum hirsutum TaxID=265104 RepID=A0A9P8LBF2_9PEZI|nr:hypothetical protein GP486_004324 [Trichoglossum hirsutum]
MPGLWEMLNDTMSDSPVPIVDYGLFLHGDDEDKRKLAAQVDDAFRTVGFVCLVNHGIEQAKVDECFEWSKKFFALPVEAKLLAPHPPSGSHHRGYSGISQEKVIQNVVDAEGIAAERTIPDIKESYESGNVNDERQPNIWLPEETLPGFRGFMEAFFEDCASLIYSILHALSLSLNLPPSIGLPSTHSRSLFQLRLLHYPSIPLRSLQHKEETRISPHTDYGTLTLLFQDAVGGLEVEVLEDDGNGGRTGTGVFKGVPHVEGGVLLNLGDLMMRWTNDRWRSTVHQVGAPPTAPRNALSNADGVVEGEGEDSKVICPPRYSIPFFATPDPDVLIECLPGCWGPGNPKKYESVTAWEYVKTRLEAAYL